MSRDDIQQAVEVLQAGGIIAYPTESCYGLGCDPANNKAIKKLLRIKQRPWQKGLLLISAAVEPLYRYISREDCRLDNALDSWPGPTTWVVPAAVGTSHYLRGEHDGIAVRVTGHPLASLLCRTFRGPIVSTSANLAGYAPALSASGVRRYFPDEEIFVVEGAIGDLEKPTAIYDLLSGKVIRN